MKRALLLLFITSWSFAQTPATALDFDGVDDYVDLGVDTVFDYTSTSTFTLEAWINSAGSTKAWNVILAKDTYNSQLGWIFYLDGGNLYFRNTDSSPEQFVGATLSTQVNNWVHVAVTYDNSSVQLYENGVLKAVGNVNLSSNTSQSLFLGARHNNNGIGFIDAFNGTLDEVRIWDIVRTQSEIENSKDCAILSSTPNLVSYYDFNQGEDNADNSAETTLVSSNTAYNGTLNNFTLMGNSSNFVDGSANSVDDCTLSNSNVNLNSLINVFPNPSKGLLFISNKQNLNLTNAIVTDLNGRIIEQIDLSQMESQQTIDMSNVTSGLYLITINSEDDSLTKKLLIK